MLLHPASKSAHNSHIILTRQTLIATKWQKTNFNLGPYQLPVLGIDNHGSMGAKCSPSCNNSIDTLSGDFTKAMCPSQGGLLITTPASIKVWQSP